MEIKIFNTNKFWLLKKKKKSSLLVIMFSESEASRIGENPTEADYKKKKIFFFK